MKILITLLLIVPLSCANATQQLPMNYQDSVSVDSLKMMVWSLPFKHKDIIVAQAILETGWFKSKNYQVNNNLFGMKQIYSRATTADSTINGYSHYSNWRMSVIDYYLKQSTRESIVPTTREQYFHYLDKVYSEVGSGYSSQLKDIILRLGLDNDDPQPIVKKASHRKVKHTKKKHNRKK
jgi:uncharacterized FlgJ-related protein